VSQENVEIVRRAVDAAIQHKPDWVTVNSLFDPHHELVQLPGFVDRDQSTGLGAAGFRAWRAMMDEAGEWWVEVDDARGAPDGRVAVLLRVLMKGERSGAQVEQKLCVLCSVRNGKITRTETFTGWAEALKAVGLEE
jgi:ketosteroid isomerase-like protein